MESWRLVWRQGLAPVLSTAGLQRLRDALRSDDPRLVQGRTVVPLPTVCTDDWPAEAVCAVSFCGWQGDGLESVGQVEEQFALACFEADKLLGEPSAVRYFLNWFDDTPRDQARSELLAEVEIALAQRSPTNHETPVMATPRTEYPERCPRCGSTCITDGRRVWCTFVGSQGRGPIREPSCTFGIDGLVLHPDLVGELSGANYAAAKALEGVASPTITTPPHQGIET